MPHATNSGNQEGERVSNLQDKREKYLLALELVDEKSDKAALKEAAFTIVNELVDLLEQEQQAGQGMVGEWASNINRIISDSEQDNKATTARLHKQQLYLSQYASEHGLPLPITWMLDALSYPAAHNDAEQENERRLVRHSISVNGGISPPRSFTWALSNARQAGARDAIAKAIDQLRVTWNTPENVCYEIMRELEQTGAVSPKTTARLERSWIFQHIGKNKRHITPETLAEALTIAYKYQRGHLNRGITAFVQDEADKHAATVSPENMKKFITYLNNVRRFEEKADQSWHNKMPDILARLTE